MFVLAWLVFTIVVILIANRLGRSLILWGVLSLVLSPLLTGLILLAMGKTDEKKLAEMRHLKELESRI